MAPEARLAKNRVQEKTDIYQLGMTMLRHIVNDDKYELLVDFLLYAPLRVLKASTIKVSE